MKKQSLLVCLLALLLCCLLSGCGSPADKSADSAVSSGSGQDVELPGGSAGVAVIWQLRDGVLTISGEGMMDYYSLDKHAPWYDHAKSIRSVVIEQGVTNISHYAFQKCANLTEITIPDSVAEIGSKIFEDCGSLASITVAEGNSRYFTVENCLVEKASRTLLYGCQTSVIPDDGSVSRIGESAFAGSSGLTSITVPEGVTEVSNFAFAGCAALQRVDLPAGVTRLGSFAFSDCTALKSITVPEGITAIEDSTFKGCKALESVILPKSLSDKGYFVFDVGYAAFEGCDALKEAVFPGSEEDFANLTVFGGNDPLLNALKFAEQ